MTPERLPRLFQKCTGAATKDGKGGLAGTGLRLAICKGLVEAHGGRVRAEPDAFVVGPLALRYEQRHVGLDDHPAQLTSGEYELPRVLSSNTGRVLTLQSLLRQVSGRSHPLSAKVALRSVGYRMPSPEDVGQPETR